MRHIRVFLSSPGDVSEERQLAMDVMEQVPYNPQLRGKISLEVVAWDKPGAGTPLLANMTPQEAINQGLPRPSECDIVIVLFWTRIGTLLSDTHKKADGSRYLSGTEWEYWDAFNHAKIHKTPYIVVYRRTERLLIDPMTRDGAEKFSQIMMVNSFFKDFTNPDGSFQKGYNNYNKPDDFKRDFENHLLSLIARILETSNKSNSKVNKLKLWKGSPFPGLRAFTHVDNPIFFGRGIETDALVERVRQRRFVAVIGASGAGKSSLVGAGLLVRLFNNAIHGSKDWKYLQFTPGEVGDNPFMALAVKLAPLVKEVPRDLANALHENPYFIIDKIKQVLDNKPNWVEMFLFIDQFEELFTLAHGEYLQHFVDLLDIIHTTGHVRIVVTMRSDFYHRCIDLLKLANLLQDGTFPLAIPGLYALREMIIRPAERAGLQFEFGLPDKVLDDTGNEAGTLALMAYALDELYQVRESDGILSFAGYNLIGGVQGAIGERAEKTYLELDADARSALTRVFRELLEVDDRGTATRQRAQLIHVTKDEAATRLVGAFTEARLLVTDRGIVEVAHEALLRSWPRLAKWIEEVQGDLRLLRQVRVAAAEWERRNRRKDYLWSHERLSPVYNMIERMRLQPEPILEEFIIPEHKRLIDELLDPNILDYRRSAIADRLADIGEPVLDDVVELFSHDNKWIRATSVQTLVQIGKPSIPYLASLLAIANDLTARRIGRALSQIDGASDVFFKAIFYENPFAVIEAIERLWYETKIIPLVINISQEVPTNVKNLIGQFLQTFGQKDRNELFSLLTEEHMGQLNSMFDEGNLEMALGSANLLSIFQDKRALPQIVELLSFPDHLVQLIDFIERYESVISSTDLSVNQILTISQTLMKYKPKYRFYRYQISLKIINVIGIIDKSIALNTLIDAIQTQRFNTRYLDEQLKDIFVHEDILKIAEAIRISFISNQRDYYIRQAHSQISKLVAN